MKMNTAAMMGKMSGGDLGRLFLKDMVGLLVDGTAVYSVDEFESSLDRIDRNGRYEFAKYKAAAAQLAHLTTISRWMSALIREYILRIEVVMGFATLSGVGHAASQLMILERLRHGFYDPWDSEKLLREQAKELSEALLGRKEDIQGIYNHLESFIRMHLAIEGAMASLAEIMQMSEIASIPNKPMMYVEMLNKSVRDLEDREDRYCEVFPEIDISSLQPSQADIDEWVTRVTDVLE